MFGIENSDGEARTGTLSTPSGAINTPAFLLYNHRGSALHLTPDLVEKLKPELQGLQIDVLQFLTQPKPEVIRQFAGSGRRFLALDNGCVLVATARDPAVYEYAGAMRQATNEWASVTVHTGSVAVTPAQYMEAVAALAPDIWVALSDDIPTDSRSDRVPKSVDRTVAWLRECLAAAASAPELAGAAAFAAVQGGQYLQERQRCAEAVAAQPGVSGFVLAGLGTGESPGQRREIVEAVLQKLPAAAPRLLSGVGTPEEVLEGVAQGVDLFDMGHLAEVTEGGYALCFPVSPAAEQEQQQQQQQHGPPAAGVAAQAAAAAASANANANGASSSGGGGGGGSSGGDDSKLNLWALDYRTDARALLPGCACFTCRNHTRAYLHHLLQTHEMTAQVLLEVHNTHHYLRFFKAIRASIASGGFAAYREWFLQRRQRRLVGDC